MEKRIQKNRGDASMIMVILMVLVAIFIIWVLTGGPKKSEGKPYITPGTDQSAPLQPYGP